MYVQDKAIAFKIFELGLKRFADEPTYVLAYLDHLSHLNGQHIPMMPVWLAILCMCIMASTLRIHLQRTTIRVYSLKKF